MSDIDIGQITEALNDKMDRDGVNATASVCIESWHEGTEWYRVYSDGWCEQGGYTTNNSNTINFLKEFVDTNYSVFQTPQAVSTSSFQARTWYVSSKLTASVTFAGSNDPAYWETKGYIR